MTENNQDPKETPKKMPWEYEDTPWNNQSQFMTYLRGCLRKAWNQYPLKHNLIKQRRIQVPNPNPKGKRSHVWGFQCELCGCQDVIKNANVDHINPAGKLNNIEDIQGFVERLLIVGYDDLRILCKHCNSSLDYAEKQGITFKKAKATKGAIAIQKGDDKHWLLEQGVEPASSKAKRREQIIDILEKQSNS